MTFITRDEALEKAEKFLTEKVANPDYEYELAYESIIERPYGWVFYWNSKEYYATRDREHFLVGCSPFLVEKQGGKIIIFGSAHSLSFYLKNYEEKGNPHYKKKDILDILFDWAKKRY